MKPLLLCIILAIAINILIAKPRIENNPRIHELIGSTPIKSSNINPDAKDKSSAKAIVDSERLDNNYFNNQVYLRLKTNNIVLTQIDPDNNKLYSNTFSNAEMDRLGASYGITKIEQAFKLNPKSKHIKNIQSDNNLNKSVDILNRTFVVFFNSNINVNKFIEDFSKFDNVDLVEKIPINKVDAVPNDTKYNELFYLPLIQADSAWNIHKGENGDSTVIIGICDSGTEWIHSDLVSNLYQNLAEDADGDGHTIEFINGQWVLDPGDLNNIDDDGNGYTDDLIGWNFYSYIDDTPFNDPNATTPNIHGTHVAGIAAGATNNSNGVASISWNVKFLPTKHSSNGAYNTNSVYNVYDGIVFLSESGADIINCSWGGGDFSETEEQIIEYATSLGSIVVASAGNANNDEIFYPSAYQNVLSVASISINNTKAYYSSFGNNVDISAYGGDKSVDTGILSSVPGNTYDYLQGTSMASPLVSGLLALIKSYMPKSNNSKILEILLANADNIDSLNPRYQKLLGYGKINAFKSLRDTNKTLSNKLKLLKLRETFVNGVRVFNPNDTIKIIYQFENKNILYGANSLTYSFTAIDTNVVILNSSKTIPINKDSRFTLDTLFAYVRSNAAFAKSGINVNFSCNAGFVSDSIFTTNFIIKNGTLNAFSYVAYGGGVDPEGTIKINLLNPSSYNYISTDGSGNYATAGTWFQGKWLVADNNNFLSVYDTTDGTKTNIMSLGVRINGMAYDPSTNLIWGVGDDGNYYDKIFIIDPNSKTISLLYEPKTNKLLINLAIDKYGNLLSLDIRNDKMIFIDKYSGLLYDYANFNRNYNYAQDMEYNFNNDLMILESYTSADESIISIFDIDSKKIIDIGNVKNNSELTGLAIPKNYKPNKIDLIAPAYNSVNSNQITLKWKKRQNASYYTLYLSKYSDFSAYESFHVNDTTLVINKNEIGLYYWIVESNENSTFETSGIWKFQISYCNANNTYCDEYISKFEFGSFVKNSVCGLINGYSDYTSDTINAYKEREYAIKVTNYNAYAEDKCRLWIDLNNNLEFDNNEFYTLQSSDGNYTFTDAIKIDSSINTINTRLRVRLIYGDLSELIPCGTSYYGETEDYTINIIDFKPVLLYPANNQTNILTDTILYWSNPIGAVKYDIQVSKFSNFSTLVINDTNLTINNYHISGISYSTQYYWRVRAKDSNYVGAWSNIFSFTTRPQPTIPTLSTTNITNISSNSATCGGNISNYGGASITARGVCWATSQYPTINDSKTTDGSGIGSFTSSITGLNSNTTYYVRSYATNSVGTAYGEQKSFKTDSTTIQYIYLDAGWNNISSYILPQYPLMDSLFNEIVSSLIICKDSKGKTFIPAYNINNIGNWDYKQGYMLYMSNSDTIGITGMQIVPENEDITLNSGWSIVSYLRNTGMNIVGALETLTNDNALVIAKNRQGKTYIPQYNINQIGNMTPGQGYQMYLNKTSTLTYPSNSAGKEIATEITPSTKILKPEYSITGNSAVAIIEVEAKDGSEIGVYNQNEELIGTGAIYNNVSSVTIWGDNTQTQAIDGAINNEELTLKFYDIASNKYSKLILRNSSDIRINSIAYRTDAIYLLKATVEELNTKIELTISPNPTNDYADIIINHPNTAINTLKLYNLQGKLLQDLTNRLEETSDTQTIRLSLNNLPNGEYTIVLTSQTGQITKKIIVSK